MYLQNKERFTDFPKDSVITRYKLFDYEYHLKTGDIITVNLASLTSEEYDFFHDYIMKLGPLVRTPYWFGLPGMSNSRGGGGGGGSRNNNNQNNQGGSMGSEFMVDSAGMVQLPVMGSVEVKGLTLNEAENAVEKAAKGYFEDPMVRINIQNFQVNMLGEVNEEGLINVRDPEVNIFEAISMAGNLTEVADRENVKIVRKEGKMARTIYVNLLEEKFLSSENFYLRPGDMVIVPPLKAKERQQYTLPNYRTILSAISTTLVLILTIDRITDIQ